MKQKLIKVIAPAALLGLTALPLLQAPVQAKTHRRVVHRTVVHRTVVYHPVVHHAVVVHHPVVHHPIVRREWRQTRRIERGERHGSLTNRESERLETREARIRAAAIRDRRTGGRFTRGERNSIEHRLTNVNRSIYREKHDREHR